MHIVPGDLRTPEANDHCHQTAPIAEMVRKYMTAMEKSAPLKAISLDENFQLLAEFNGRALTKSYEAVDMDTLENAINSCAVKAIFYNESKSYSHSYPKAHII